MTELSPEAVEVQATPDLSDLARYTGLSSLEIAAAKTDFHMSTCPLNVWDCPDCTKKLKEIKAILAVAKGPGHECMYSQIYTNAEKALDELLGPNEEDGCGGGLVADIWHLARRCEHYEGNPDESPVAAASNPTDTPRPDTEGGVDGD